MSSGNNGLIEDVTFVSDLMNSNGKFLTFEEFQNKFEIKANYLHYFELITAIPPDLKRTAFGSTVPDLLGATSEYCQIEDRTIVLTKFRCKNYYSLFIEKPVSEPSAGRAWKKSFSELPDWGDCFVNIYSGKSSKDNIKLRQFTFKVVHRIITTKKELVKYKLASGDNCVHSALIQIQLNTPFYIVKSQRNSFPKL